MTSALRFRLAVAWLSGFRGNSSGAFIAATMAAEIEMMQLLPVPWLWLRSVDHMETEPQREQPTYSRTVMVWWVLRYPIGFEILSVYTRIWPQIESFLVEYTRDEQEWQNDVKCVLALLAKGIVVMMSKLCFFAFACDLT